VEESGADKKDLVGSGILCRGKTAAEYLAPVGGPSPPFRHPHIDTFLSQERFHRRYQVDVLDGGYKTGGLPSQERNGSFQHRHIETYRVGKKDDPVLHIDRCMADMDEHIGKIKGAEREIAGTVTGIAADDDIKPCFPERTRVFRCPAFQAGGELEGDLLCSPLPQLPDKVRDIA
jgi:hypothetical protein